MDDNTDSIGPKRETMTLYVTGNGSDSGAVQQVLNELANVDDDTLIRIEGLLESELEVLDVEIEANAPDDPDADCMSALSDEDRDYYNAVETIMELLSEIRLYNRVQRMDPISSALISRDFGI